LPKYTKVTISEVNEHGYGWSAEANVEEGNDDQVSFDIRWEHTDEEGSTEVLESVGVLMTPEGANELSRQLENAAYKIRRNTEDKSNG
jgi:hypothetical protein